MENTFGSLFSGCGAMDYGFEQAGWECKWQVEIDENCQKVLAKHFPNTIKHTDVKTVDPKYLSPVTMIVGGVPCTDLSVASFGSHEGIEGNQSGLIHDFARIVDELLPEYFVIENVPKLLSVWDKVLQLGYFKHYETYGKELIGADFGAYTRRKRAFLVGCLRDEGERKVFNFPVGNKPTFSTRGSEDVLPICLPWKGGVSLERLGSCVITEINSVRTM